MKVRARGDEPAGVLMWGLSYVCEQGARWLLVGVISWVGDI